MPVPWNPSSLNSVPSHCGFFPRFSNRPRLWPLAKSPAARHNVTPPGPVLINGAHRMTYRIRFILMLFALVVFSPAALAVIKVTNTVAKMYNEGNSIVVGKVTKVNDNGVIEAAVTTLKGEG